MREGDWSHISRRWLAFFVPGAISLLCFGIATATSLPKTNIDIVVVRPVSRIPILPASSLSSGEIKPDNASPTYRVVNNPPISLLDSPEQDLADIRLVASDLVNASMKSAISSAMMDIRVVKPWFQGASAWNDWKKQSPNDMRQVIVPELLLKDDSLVDVDSRLQRNYVTIKTKAGSSRLWVNPPQLAAAEQIYQSVEDFPIYDAIDFQPFDLVAGQAKQIWITLHVPDSIESGEYFGHVDVYLSDRQIGSLEMQATVHAFELPDPSLVYSVYYRAQLDEHKASVGSEFKSSVQMRSELTDIAAHGVTSPTLYQRLVDRIGLEMSLQMRQLAGVNRGSLYYLGVQTTAAFLGDSQPVAEASINRATRFLAALANKYGYLGVSIYGRDEAEGPALVAQKRLWDAVHDAGGRVFVAGQTGAYDLVGGTLDTLVHFGKPDYIEADKWHFNGHQIFNYSNPQSGPENPYLFRLNYGFVLWANDYDGAMPYAYQHCFGSCWNDVDHPVYRDHALTYPTALGPIPTLAWEGFREAIDDVRYISVLEELVRRNSGVQSNVAVERARRFLGDLKARLRIEQIQGGKWNQDVDIDLDAVRNAVVMHISAISKD